MTFALAPEAMAAGYGLAAYETIDSTSAEAGRRARAGERGPLWVVSRAQSAGTGRRGTRWETPAGNLAASLLLTTDLPPATIAQLGFVAGLALSRALSDVCGSALTLLGALDGARHGGDRFTLKWPNDVLAEGGKLAGILLGTEAVSDGRRAAVIGIGLNLAYAPEGLPYPASSLAGLGYDLSPEEVFCALSAAWATAFATWTKPDGFSEIRRLWLARAAGLGADVAVRTVQGVTRGVFETIDESGHLIVRVADGSTRAVSAGEVHFGMAASARGEELRA